MKVYVGGGNGDSGVKTLTGFDDFIKFISEGGHFSAETPGKPIFCSFAYLSDHSPYKVKFKIDIDSDPVYARIEYRNLKNDSYVGRSLQREKIIGDVHLAFYADRTAKIPTLQSPLPVPHVPCADLLSGSHYPSAGHGDGVGD